MQQCIGVGLACATVHRGGAGLQQCIGVGLACVIVYRAGLHM